MYTCVYVCIHICSFYLQLIQLTCTCVYIYYNRTSYVRGGQRKSHTSTPCQNNTATTTTTNKNNQDNNTNNNTTARATPLLEHDWGNHTAVLLRLRAQQAQKR